MPLGGKQNGMVSRRHGIRGAGIGGFYSIMFYSSFSIQIKTSPSYHEARVWTDMILIFNNFILYI